MASRSSANVSVLRRVITTRNQSDHSQANADHPGGDGENVDADVVLQPRFPSRLRHEARIGEAARNKQAADRRAIDRPNDEA